MTLVKRLSADLHRLNAVLRHETLQAQRSRLCLDENEFANLNPKDHEIKRLKATGHTICSTTGQNLQLVPSSRARSAKLPFQVKCLKHTV